MFTQHIWEQIQLQELQLISNNASFKSNSTALGACCIIHSCTLLVLNSEGWRETKHIMYAPSTHSSRIFMVFIVNFYQNAMNGGTFLIKARALGISRAMICVSSWKSAVSLAGTFWGAAHSSTTHGRRVRVISFYRSIWTRTCRMHSPRLKSGFAGICQNVYIRWAL